MTEMKDSNGNRITATYVAGTGKLDEVYDTLAPRLRRYFALQKANDAEAEELLHRTMLQLHASRGRFLRGADVTPWAFALAKTLRDSKVRRATRPS